MRVFGQHQPSDVRNVRDPQSSISCHGSAGGQSLHSRRSSLVVLRSCPRRSRRIGTGEAMPIR
jgi:hypothetical protein